MVVQLILANTLQKRQDLKQKEVILIVDDDESSCKTLSHILNKWGFETDIANSGHEATEKIMKRFFNIILLDIKLPDIEGLKLIKPLKERYPDTEVVMITAYASLEKAVRALNGGAFAFIRKPLNMDEVKVTIRNILEKQYLIQEKRQSEQMLKQTYTELEQIFNITSPLCFIDMNFNLIQANDTFLSLTQLEKEDIIGKKCYEVVAVQNCNTSECTMKQILDGENYVNYEKNVNLKNGSKITCIVRAVPYRETDGKIIGIIENYTNITNRKIAEQKLKKSEKKYRSAFKRANFYQDILTHDMNNILQSLFSSTELLSMYQINSKYSEKINEILQIFGDQVKRAAKLISNVRKFSELQSSDVPLKKIEASQILNNAINNVNQMFKSRKIRIHLNSCSTEIYVRANELLIDVFENVLINAIKFNYNPIIEISIQVSKMSGKSINYNVFEFIDNGIGIPDNMKEKIFLGGYRTDKNIHGMGLGLSLVKKIIKSYNGNIKVDNKVKGDYTKGSNFIILIPSTV